jgi:hypothetical protein
MSGFTDNLAPQQEQALLALLDEPTLLRAARSADIEVATLRRWLHDPAFLGAYRAARREIVEHVVGRLQQASSEAVEALARNLKAEKAADQIRAAVCILDRALESLVLMDLAERVEQLERDLKNRHASGGWFPTHHEEAVADVREQGFDPRTPPGPAAFTEPDGQPG